MGTHTIGGIYVVLPENSENIFSLVKCQSVCQTFVGGLNLEKWGSSSEHKDYFRETTEFVNIPPSWKLTK